jgi:acyl carrier protein
VLEDVDERNRSARARRLRRCQFKEIKQMELNGNQQAARQILENLCTKNLNSQQITGEMSINDDLGIDSLQFIRLILEVEVNAGANIFNVQNIPHIKTVNDLYEVLSN